MDNSITLHKIDVHYRPTIYSTNYNIIIQYRKSIFQVPICINFAKINNHSENSLENDG